MSIKVGFEALCRSTDCTHNDDPVCEIHTETAPIEIGPNGICVNYEKK